MSANKKQAQRRCEACGGKGYILFSNNTVNRCDSCEKFPGDLDAAAAFFRDNTHYALRDIQVVRVNFLSHKEALLTAIALLEDARLVMDKDREHNLLEYLPALKRSAEQP